MGQGVWNVLMKNQNIFEVIKYEPIYWYLHHFSSFMRCLVQKEH